MPLSYTPDILSLLSLVMTDLLLKINLVPRTRIELVMTGYQPIVIPFNYPGKLAEVVGFEPTAPCGTSVFKTAALSQTQPHFQIFEIITNMAINIIDNALSRSDHYLIEHTLLSTNISWNYLSFVTYQNKAIAEEKHNFTFAHDFYSNFSPRSEHFDLLKPILKKLNAGAIMRIKANLHPITNSHVKFHLHTDAKDSGCKTALYYVNDNNGYTIFEDGTQIESKANRLVIFDEHVLHAGVTCTDQKVRCVINFNFYPYIGAPGGS